MNSLKTAVLLGLLTGLLVLIGGYLGGRNGMFIAFIFAMGMNFFSYWFSDKIVLRMYQAQEVTPQQAPESAPDGAGPGHEGGPAHAARLHHPRGHAQRLCNGPKRKARRSGRHRRDHADPEPRGARGRHQP